MNKIRATALQYLPFSSYMEEKLADRFNIVRWFDMDSESKKKWLCENAESVSAIVTAGDFGCTNDLMQALPKLRIIAINGVGLDKVDMGLARKLGVPVTITSGLLTEDVADLGVGLIISLLRGIHVGDNYVRAGKWLKKTMPLATKVTGRKFGVLGLGAIGSAIAARLAPFGEVHYTSRSQKEVPYHYQPNVLSLAKNCDVLVIACAANFETQNMVNRDVLQALGGNGWLINISRGAVVDEPALIRALYAGTIAGAGLDVYANEPNVPQALIDSGKVVLTPHIASATEETRKAMADNVLANLDAAMDGNTLISEVT